MTREEAAIKSCEDRIKHLKSAPTHHYGKRQRERAIELEKVKIKALRPVSREQVEKVWRGEWEFDAAEPNGKFGGIRCSKCHAAVSFGGENAFHNAKAFDSFCPFCGAPMTDEAVDNMVMENGRR